MSKKELSTHHLSQQFKERLGSQPVVLPETFAAELHRWPELKSLLTGFSQRDPVTFMHCIAVHYAAHQLLRDLALRCDFSPRLQAELLALAPFWLMHDIGKVAADPEEDRAHHIVHPRHQTARPSEEMGRHWVHPVMGAELITHWGNQQSPAVWKRAQNWAELTRVHHAELVPYIGTTAAAATSRQSGAKKMQPNWFDSCAMLCFTVSDVAVAMGLPRPHKEDTAPTSVIKTVIGTHYLPSYDFSQLFPGFEQGTAEYILASVSDSLGTLKSQYSTQDWLQPAAFQADSFEVSVATKSVETEYLQQLIAQSWQESESFWASTMLNMDTDGVFARAK